MEVKLKYITPLDLVVDSIRICYDSQWRSDSKWTLIKDLKRYNSDQYILGIKDKDLIQKCMDNAHESVLRHSLIHYEVSDLPRSMLQQVVRHGVGISYSVQSTRFTLSKELKHEPSFLIESDGYNGWDWKRASKYIHLTDISEIDDINISTLEKVRQFAVDEKFPNDTLKHALPEVYNCKYRVSYNIQSLKHFFEMRSASDAHPIIQELANKMYDALPDDYKFLFRSNMKSN